jgi:aminopeptidase II. Metallo peptidase. MEROPS family M29
MTLDKKLDKYAKLIVHAGLNVQKGQEVVIDAAIEAASLVRRVTKEAYEVGAKEVIVRYSDEVISRLKFEYGEAPLFTHFPQWLADYYNQYAKNGAAFLSIISDDPEAFKGVDAIKMANWASSKSKATQPFRESLDKAINTWCIVGASSRKWANKVFPDMSDDAAVNALWDAIFETVKVNHENPIEAWQQHRHSFEKRITYLNSLQLQYLTYTNNLGTNLTIGLPDDYEFAGGGSYTVGDVFFFPNMPTEEVFTTPHKDKAEGIVYNALPLNYNGNLIDDFFLEFKAGKIVNFGAKHGEDILKELIATDEGSSHLGEVALVPYDSPISNMNILFYNTLFDENAVSHLAIGKAYPECVTGGLQMNKEELLEKGVNDSLVHVDFMIGTADLKIVGTTKDNKKVDIFMDGNFAL